MVVPEAGVNFPRTLLESIVDISRLHGETIPLTDVRDRYAGFLLLNQGNLQIKTDATMSEHEIWEVAPYPNPERKTLINKKTYAEYFESGFAFDVGSKTEVRVESQVGFSIVLNHEENILYQIVFDNDCHIEESPCETSDFKFYYQIINEDQLKTKRRFDILPVITDDKRPHGSCLGGGGKNLLIPDGLI